MTNITNSVEDLAQSDIIVYDTELKVICQGYAESIRHFPEAMFVVIDFANGIKKYVSTDVIGNISAKIAGFEVSYEANHENIKPIRIRMRLGRF